MTAPNVEHIRLWVEALESGEFEQGRECLAQNGKYCCLGVACEVAIANGVALEKETRPSGLVSYSGTGWFLPAAVMEWLGVSHHNPLLGAYRASEWNDTEGLSFRGIAALIREEYGLEEASDGE